jgi:hypothetical protein
MLEKSRVASAYPQFLPHKQFINTAFSANSANGLRLAIAELGVSFIVPLLSQELL